MSSQTVTEGQAAKLKTNTFTKTGYTFTAWNTKADGTGTAYNDGADVTLHENTTLYAQWTINTYSFSFDANGGSGSMSGGSAATRPRKRTCPAPAQYWPSTFPS